VVPAKQNGEEANRGVEKGEEEPTEKVIKSLFGG